jgi:hypothetical protein
VVGQADVVIGTGADRLLGTVNAFIDNGEDLRESRVKPGAR